MHFVLIIDFFIKLGVRLKDFCWRYSFSPHFSFCDIGTRPDTVKPLLTPPPPPLCFRDKLLFWFLRWQLEVHCRGRVVHSGKLIGERSFLSYCAKHLLRVCTCHISIQLVDRKINWIIKKRKKIPQQSTPWVCDGGSKSSCLWGQGNKGGNFIKRNCGAASVGEYNKVIWSYQLSC